jgi:mycothione reductase
VNEQTDQIEHFDLAIIGTGSGNSLVTPDFEGKRVAVIEGGTFGGTCLNVGCIPTKMFVYAAEVAASARDAARYGVDATVHGVRWADVRDRVFQRIDPIAEGGKRYRVEGPGTTAFLGHARFTGDRRLTVDLGEAGERSLTADQVVIAAGAHPVVPDVVRDSGVPFHTSDTIMRIDELPEHLLVYGAGYIAAELAHVFGALGVRVTILARSETMLTFEDDDIRMRFTEVYRHRPGFEVLCSTQVVAARNGGDGIELEVSVDGEHRTITGDMLLVATGRRPNTDDLDVAATGVDVDALGFVTTDDYLRTTAAGVWALGDICHPAMLKHAANADARVVAHNLVHPGDLRAVDRRFLPHAVFGHPQVASVGATERVLSAADVPITVALQPFGSAAYGWAMEDTESLCKLIAHRDTRQLLGAHIVGPQASTLLQQLVQGMRFGLTVDEMARDQYYIHPALTEVVEQALLAL